MINNNTRWGRAKTAIRLALQQKLLAIQPLIDMAASINKNKLLVKLTAKKDRMLAAIIESENGFFPFIGNRTLPMILMYEPATRLMTASREIIAVHATRLVGESWELSGEPFIGVRRAPIGNRSVA